MMPAVHLGFDDTDSKEGMCTTYLAALVVEVLLRGGARFLDYPNLIRLNPNVVWKTRGNAAVSLRFLADEPQAIFHEACEIVSRYSDTGKGRANPGVVMLVSNEIPDEVRLFSNLALSCSMSLRQACALTSRYGMSSYALGNGMGIVGALAAIGNSLDADHTYELMAYRATSNRGRERRIAPQSVIEMSRSTYHFTYNNYDPETGRILITPHGPDPVLFGIRGESPEQVMKAFKMLRVEEPIERYVIFRTNQGTGVHLIPELDLGSLRAYTAGHVIARVSERPTIREGGHVYFKIKNQGGEGACAVYEPAGDLRKKVLQLIPGDMVEVGGGVRRRTTKHPTIINVEYIKVAELAGAKRHVNPICRRCGARMKSQGRGQGFRCDRCGKEDGQAKRAEEEVARSIKEGLYIPPPRAQRHLAKPLQRYGLEKSCHGGQLIEDWFWLENGRS